MLKMVDYVHDRIRHYGPMDIGVDMTMGRGSDTAFLLECCDEVYAFDILEDALRQTQNRIGDDASAHLILDSHTCFNRYVDSFDVGIFNLGYLPTGDHQQTTLLESTKIAIPLAVEAMKKVLFIVVYPGHNEGLKESVWIDEYVSMLDSHLYNVSCFKMMNKQGSPYVIEVERRH